MAVCLQIRGFGNWKGTHAFMEGMAVCPQVRGFGNIKFVMNQSMMMVVCLPIRGFGNLKRSADTTPRDWAGDESRKD